MILAVETSTRKFSMYIEDANNRSKNLMFANLDILFDITHSQGIVQSARFLLNMIGGNIKDLKGLYAGLGPGSFTGIRVGLSFINTLAQILRIPVGGASSLDILAYETTKWESGTVAFIRSRKGEVFTSFYDNLKRVDPYRVMNSDEFIKLIENKRPDFLVGPKEDFNDIIASNYEISEDVKIKFAYPSAKFIPALVNDKIRGSGLKKEYLKPLYVRDF